MWTFMLNKSKLTVLAIVAPPSTKSLDYSYALRIYSIIGMLSKYPTDLPSQQKNDRCREISK